ncbi:hypothetical protein QYF36_019549 [Acer negundo]|nr:hypothetical protein QYF36_019549 [Acer negundo]
MDDSETRRNASSTSEVNAKSDHTPAVANDDEVSNLLFDPIENRYKEEEARAEATRDLLKCATDYKMVVGSLPSSVRDEVIEECNKAEQWLQEKTREQNSTCKYIMRSKPSPQGRDEANGPDRRRKSDDMQID